MSEPTDESQDWPLRDYSQRLRPPGRTDEPLLDEPELPPASASEPEILYDEDELEEDPEALVEIEEHAVPVVAPPAEEPESPAEEPSAEELPAPPEEHAGGDFRVPDGYQALEGTSDGTRRAVAVVVSRYNGEITNRLLESALGALDEAGVARDAILVVPVPGAFELPLAAMALAKTRRYSCVVALGAVIRGETPHFDFVASEAASGLQLAGIETGVPVSFGLLTTDTAEQAEARVERGAWAARTALEMADVFAKLRASTR
jgi:6,7-dimethyl-8-ribityllumazine synthase